MNCRFCNTPLRHTMIDLGFAPPSNALLTNDDLDKPETYYPLRVRVCNSCWLVQTEDFVSQLELFNSDYPYFSSTSGSYLEHAASYANKVIARYGLNENSFVIEIGSNDGYMLKNFKAKGIPVLGIEPTVATAHAARELGIKVRQEFFTEELSRRLPQADLIIGNNVFAHVPDLPDFVRGLQFALKPRGTITLEFPHLLHLIEETQFDTIYHEHFSYFSLRTVCRILSNAALRVCDVEEISVHGGALRVYICHSDDPRPNTAATDRIIEKEIATGLFKISTYEYFQKRADHIKNALLNFLIACKNNDWSIAGYGAAAKGNTLLNYAGIKPDLLPFITDDAPSKQGKYMPGSHIPILAQSTIEHVALDYLLILPWNLVEELRSKVPYLTANGTKLVTTIPKLRIHDESTIETTDQLGRTDAA